MTGSGKEREPKERKPKEPELEDEIVDLANEFGQFTSNAQFVKEDGMEKCKDPRVKEKARRFFKAVGFEEKINSKKMACAVLRLRPGNTHLAARSADLFPIFVWGNNLTINGKELAPGQSTHIRNGVTIRVEEGSTVDLLYLVEKEKNK